MHLPSGGKPPATDDDECLRMFRDSEFGKGSVSEVVNLLPLALAWDKFYQIEISMQSINSKYTFPTVLIYDAFRSLFFILHMSSEKNRKCTVMTENSNSCTVLTKQLISDFSLHISLQLHGGAYTHSLYNSVKDLQNTTKIRQ